jgi:hypothetical protein
MSFRRVHLVVAVLLVGAGTVQAGEKCRQAPPQTSDEYLAAGPYPVGVRTR